MFTTKYVYMDMLFDGFGSYGGRKLATPIAEVEKEISLQEQLRQIKQGEKPKEKSTSKYQLKL